MLTCGVETCYYNDNGICNNNDVQISETGICISWDNVKKSTGSILTKP